MVQGIIIGVSDETECASNRGCVFLTCYIYLLFLLWIDKVDKVTAYSRPLWVPDVDVYILHVMDCTQYGTNCQ